MDLHDFGKLEIKFTKQKRVGRKRQIKTGKIENNIKIITLIQRPRVDAFHHQAKDIGAKGSSDAVARLLARNSVGMKSLARTGLCGRGGSCASD